MIGIDTSFLVAFEVSSHPLNGPARQLAEHYQGESFGLAPQVVAEFIHVVTDPKRFEYPLLMPDALGRAGRWWNARETVRIAPGGTTISQFLSWMKDLRLGRKRILDTLLAATYTSAGISLIATTDVRDFAQFPGLHPLVPGRTPA